MCLKIVVERWFWKFKMLVGSLVELHALLHSYLCFSLLEKLIFSWLDTSWHFYLSRITEDLYKGQARSDSQFYRSLSRQLCPFTSPNHSLSLQTTFQVIFDLFASFLFTWYVPNLSFSCIFMFWNLGFGGFENFWGFSKLMSFCWNLGWVLKI